MARPDHISYGKAGLGLALNQYNTTSCKVGSKTASWAAGHLATAETFLYGTYEASLQPAHAAGGGTPPANAFSCWTPSYVGTPHNEIAICFSGSNSRSVHFSYWYDAAAHTTLLDVPWEFSAAFHTYKVVWAPTGIQFFIDGALAHAVTGTTETIPFTAGYSAMILRPKTTAFLGDSGFSAEYMSYSPNY